MNRSVLERLGGDCAGGRAWTLGFVLSWSGRGWRLRVARRGILYSWSFCVLVQVFNGLKPPTHYVCEERRDILRFKHWVRDVLQADVVGVILSHQAYQAIGGLGTRMPNGSQRKKRSAALARRAVPLLLCSTSPPYSPSPL